jgi:hypothetical protein
MTFVVETNVALVANRRADHASPECVLACTRVLNKIMESERIAIDDRWEVLSEYKKKLRSSGEPGVGDAFLRFVLTNLRNPARCAPVPMVNFPSVPTLASFHSKDRKFVRVALAHPDRPVILNAVDTDWRPFELYLTAHGVRIEFLCPEHA